MSFSHNPNYPSFSAPPAYDSHEDPFFANKNPLAPSAPPEEFDSQVPLAIEEASAPPADQSNLGLSHISYDQVVTWWNKLSVNERTAMMAHERVLQSNRHALTTMREEYSAFYPKEYFPKRVTVSNALCASDYYVMYYFCDQMRTRYPDWFTKEAYQDFQAQPPAYDDLPQPPSYEEATAWWNSLPADTQASLRNRNTQASQVEVQMIRQEYAPYYRYYARPYPDVIFYNDCFDLYDFYLMSRFSSRLCGLPVYRMQNYLLFKSLEMSVHMAAASARFVGQSAVFAFEGMKATGHLIGSGAQAAGGFFGAIGNNVSGGGSSSSSDNDAGAIILGIFVMIGVAAAASAAFVASIYTSVKTAASLENLLSFKKLGRSLWRLACTAGGAFGGVQAGFVVGAATGSVIPGIGTAVGAIVGAVFLGCIGSAVGALFGKYSAQLSSHLSQPEENPNPISTTNSDKWNVEEIETALRPCNMGHAEIVNMLQHLKHDKNQHKSLSGSFVGTSDHTEKHRYNKFLEAIKSGKDPHFYVRVDNNTLFKWDNETQTIDRKFEDMPIPTALRAGL